VKYSQKLTLTLTLYDPGAPEQPYMTQEFQSTPC